MEKLEEEEEAEEDEVEEGTLPSRTMSAFSCSASFARILLTWIG